MKFLPQYGETVSGYDIPVLNEREARAAAGILFALGLLSLQNSLMLGMAFMSKLFVGFFTVDFLIRVVNPRYAPSLLMGRFFVRHQTPEYVGAAQKRFAWLIGLALALPMFYFVTLHFTPGIWKVFICMLCLVLLLLESAFSICVGCWLYGRITGKPTQHCPGGACELRVKDPIQQYTPMQALIALVSAAAIVYGIYYYATEYENRSPFAKHLKKAMMSEEEIEQMEYQKELEEFENDDDF